MRDLDIAEVARRSGVPASALRYYEEKGLISSIGRRGLKRLFDAHVLDQLTLIAAGRSAGFSLDDMAGMFTPTGRVAIDRPTLRKKADELAAMARRLKGLRDGLRHAADCPAPSHMECPKFREMITNAAASQRKKSSRLRNVGIRCR